MKVLKGQAVVGGIGIGKARFLRRGKRLSPPKIIKGEEAEQIIRLERAIEKTRKELEELKAHIEETLGKEHALILDAQLLILQDKKLLDELTERIIKNLDSAERAIKNLIEKYHGIFSQVEDYHIREKVHDIEDILRRIEKNLGEEAKEESWEGSVVVAKNIFPSETAHIISRGKPEAFVLEFGGETYHAVILARAYGIPTVVGIENVETEIREGEEVVVNGDEGIVIVSPSRFQISNYVELKKSLQEERARLKELLLEPNETLDGEKFSLFVNIEFPAEAELISPEAVEGIGLFRSEYLLLLSQRVPPEEEQYQIYSQLSEKFKWVIIRLFDLGAEKKIADLPFHEEENPAMGERGIRYLFSHRDLLYPQVRAILRASAQRKNIKLMAPMVTNIKEIKKLLMVVEDAKGQLRMEKKPFHENLPVGVMVEVPSLALMADRVSKIVDFLSIGTNDLSQYIFAADRANERVSLLCNPLDPAFLKLLRFTIKKAQDQGKEIAVCGEMASRPLHALSLLGIGLREFSVSPAMLPVIKRVLSSVEVQVIRKKINSALRLSDGQELEEYLRGELEKIYPEIYRWIRRICHEKNRKTLGI